MVGNGRSGHLKAISTGTVVAVFSYTRANAHACSIETT